ncbi:MAG: hypothetical protein QN176_14400 [Armatimonadota bacterium]|nr:hypothetical protein [Armatimonadota bacterium]
MVVPFPHRRAWLRGFWLTMSLACGVLAGALAWGLSAGGRVAVALIAAIAVAVPGLLRPDLARQPLRAWNALARLVARAAAAWLTAVAFHVVIRAMRGTGSSLRPEPPVPQESLWTPWPEGRTGDILADGIVAARSAGSGWVGAFASWVRASRNLWGLALLPVLLVLSALDTPQEVETPPPGIYTLY